ncbi:MAG: hypothetical protein ACI870_000251 [Crocinitomicaceae bacterium]|jgi:hypothetical protein
MNNKYTYPLDFRFNIGTVANDFIATDADGIIAAYVRQNIIWKSMKREVVVYSDKNKEEKKYTINAETWLDFNIAYQFQNKNGEPVGKILKKGYVLFGKLLTSCTTIKTRKILLLKKKTHG